MPLEITNTAIVTDMALIEATVFIEDGVVTPSTLFAMNNLVQAVVLHDTVILGMAGLVGSNHPRINAIADALGTDISKIPRIGQFQDALPASVYPKILHWVASDRPIASISASAEFNHLSVVLDYLRVRKLVDINEDHSLKNNFGVVKPFSSSTAVVDDQRIFQLFEVAVAAKGGTPITANDLWALRDLAWTASAGYTLSRNLHVNVYHSLTERPFYGSELREPKGPLNLVSKATEEVTIEDAYFDEILIPPFLGLILSNASFQRDVFWQILLDTRQKHRKFRKSITQFHQAWHSAKTVGEQRKLRQTHERAWEALLGKEEHLANERMTYRLGRAVTSGGRSLMTDAIKLDRFGQAISAIGGLVRLWKDLQDVTPAKDGRRVLGQHFADLASPEHWQTIQKLVASVNSAAGLTKTPIPYDT